MMNTHQTKFEEAWPTGARQNTGNYKNYPRKNERVKELAKKKAEFSQKQADRLMMLAEGTHDPQLRAQLVIMSNAWVDQSGHFKLRFKLLDAWRRYS